MIILSPNRLTFFVSWLVLGSWSPYNISLCFLCCACIMSLYGECFFWPCPPCLSPEAYRRLSLGVLHPSVFFSVVCLSLLVSALHSGLLLPVQCSGRHLFLAKSCSCSLVFSLSAGSSINLPLICYSAGHSPLFLVHCWFPGCWTSFFFYYLLTSHWSDLLHWLLVQITHGQLLPDSSLLHRLFAPFALFYQCIWIHCRQVTATLSLFVGVSVVDKSTNRQIASNSFKASGNLALGGHLIGFLTEITWSGDNGRMGTWVRQIKWHLCLWGQ